MAKRLVQFKIKTVTSYKSMTTGTGMLKLVNQLLEKSSFQYELSYQRDIDRHSSFRRSAGTRVDKICISKGAFVEHLVKRF
jgi:uncharacterized protein YbbC (DUF1343 family)